MFFSRLTSFGNRSVPSESRAKPNGIDQSKLKGISRDKRWKLIPIIYPEQKEALAIIQSGNFRRPLVKTIRKHVGENCTCYGGRKGFVDLMLGKGQRLEAVSQWMGHQTLDRTVKNYKNRKELMVPEPVGEKKDVA